MSGFFRRILGKREPANEPAPVHEEVAPASGAGEEEWVEDSWGSLMTQTNEDGTETAYVMNKHVMLATQLNMSAYASLAADNYVEAESDACAAIDALDPYIGPDDVQVVNAVTTLLAMMPLFSDDFPRDRVIARAAHTSRNPASERDPELGRLLGELGQELTEIGSFHEAAMVFNTAYRIQLNTLGNESEVTALTAYRLGVLLAHFGQLEDANACYGAAAHGFRAATGDSEDSARSLHRYTQTLYQLKRVAEALQFSEDLVSLATRACGDVHVLTGEAFELQASCYRASGDSATAEILQQHAISIFENTGDAGLRELGRALGAYAMMLYERGAVQEAVGEFNRALTCKQAALGEQDPSVAHTAHNLACIYAGNGLLEDAESLTRYAYDIRFNALGADHSETQESLRLLEQVIADRQSRAG